MPLVLSLKMGDDFYVGDRQFLVSEVSSETEFKIKDVSTGKVHTITDERSTEILQDVQVSAGDKPTALLARVAIDAPREMLVLRGDKFRNPPEKIKARK
jgi:hypothetical protein